MGMTHDELRARLFELSDGVLPPAETREVQAHLSSCGGCRRELRLWERSRSALKRGAELPPSEAFVSKVLEGLGEPRAPLAGWWSRRAPAYALAAGLAALAILTLSGGEAVSIEALLLPESASAAEWLDDSELEDDDVLTLALEDR